MSKFLLFIFEIPAVFAQSSLASKSRETASQSQAGVTSLFQNMWDVMDNWIAAIIVFVVSFYVAKLLKTAVISRISEKFDEEHQDVIDLVGRVTNLGVIALGVTVALKIAGIDITTIVAAVGFGIGFALKDLIMNFLAGVIILLSRQFNIGDFIMIDGIIGKVIKIETRSTILQSLEGTKVIVPNADLFSKQIISYTTNPFRRIDISVGVHYDTNLNKVIEIALQVLNNDPEILKEPPPVILCDEFAGSSINFFVRFWVESKSNWLQTRSRTIINIKRAFDEAGINIPYPIRTLYFANELKHYQLDKSEMKKEMASAVAVTAEGKEVNIPIPVSNISGTSLTPVQEEKLSNAIAADNKTPEVKTKKPETGADFLNTSTPPAKN